MNNTLDIIQNDEILQQILPYLQDIPAYLVGGYVRDMLLGKKSPDRDIILVCENIEEITKNIAQKLDATFIELDKDWGIYRLVLKDKKNYLDFAKAIENDINKDIMRRDITINAIAYDLNKKEFYDPTNGRKDLQNKVLREISAQNFIDDPLRIIRVFRFKSTLGFEIEEKTMKTLSQNVSLISNPAKERLNAELVKLFEGENTADTLEEMDKIGLLEIIFPFLSEIKQIPPNSHHHLDLFHHSLETVRQSENLFKTLPKEAQEILNTKPYNTVKKLAFMKLAAFMHDIGKPQTWTIDEKTGRHRFILHDSKGAELAPKYLNELKFSKKQIGYIQKLIKNHIYPSNVNIENEKSIMKFLRKMEHDTVDVILLAMGDRLSARGVDITEEMVEENLTKLNFLINKYIELLNALKPLPKLLSGNEIMEILNIPPSKQLGEIISALKEAQEENSVATKEDAIEFVKNFKII